MAFTLPQIPSDGKLSQVLHLPVLEQVYPRERIVELLTGCHRWEARERKLSQLLMVYYVISLSLWRPLNLRAVLQQLVAGLRWLWPVLATALPTAAALVYRRQQLGITVLRQLFRQCCLPLATAETVGAFQFGLRLLALDSTLDDVPDSLANALHFGRLTAGKSRSPYPQVRCLYLAEVGTHGVIDAVFAPCHVSEQRLAPALLRSLGPGRLLLCDRNFPSTKWIGQVRATGAELLARLPADRFLTPERILGDGSYLVTLSPAGQEPFQVRVIEYHLHPQLASELDQQPHSRNSHAVDPYQKHRLVTTLLDPAQAPAEALILCYHERWEVELLIDETKTPQRLSTQPLRSHTPLLLYQELYGLLLAHYAVRWWLFQSATQASLDPDQLSFTHGWHVLQWATCWFTIVSPAQVPALCQQVRADLRERASLLPARRLRFYPRVLKRAFAPFPRKQLWHHGVHFPNTTFQQLLI
jgi:hypothetical protein